MDDVIGHEPVKKVFERLILNGSLSHAYLFTGPESVGKTTLIRALSAKVLGISEEKLPAHPDFSNVVCPLDEKTGVRKTILPVESIRDLRESLSMSALSGGWRVAVMEDASAMNAAAANALLKMLEEPPARTLVFLRAARSDDLPRTIVSRAQVVRLKLVSSGAIVSALMEKGAGMKEAQELARIACGRPGVALRFLLDRQAYADWRAQTEIFRRHLQLGAADRLVFAKNLLPKDELKDHERGEAVFQTWEFVLRDGLRSPASSCRSVNALERLAQSREAFRHNTSLQLAFEHVLLSF